MDTPALAVVFIIILAIVAFGAALGGTTWVYLVDQRRPGTPKQVANVLVDALTPDSADNPTDETDAHARPEVRHQAAPATADEQARERRAA